MQKWRVWALRNVRKYVWKQPPNYASQLHLANGQISVVKQFNFSRSPCSRGRAKWLSAWGLTSYLAVCQSCDKGVLRVYTMYLLNAGHISTAVLFNIGAKRLVWTMEEDGEAGTTRGPQSIQCKIPTQRDSGLCFEQWISLSGLWEVSARALATRSFWHMAWHVLRANHASHVNIKRSSAVQAANNGDSKTEWISFLHWPKHKRIS